jgi:LacI family transcriptional regulator
LTEPVRKSQESPALIASGNSAKASAVTSHDVARLAGVSQATVSRVLRQDPKVRPETRDRVLRVLAETRYEPNAAARTFRTNRSGSIGVVVARLSYQFFPVMLEAIGAQLARLGQRMIVWDSEHGGDLPASRALRQGIIDGVILTATTRESEFLKDIVSPQAPVVLINRTVDDYPSDQVSSDNIGGGQHVAEYLLRNGRRRIALVGGVLRASTIRDRERGFRDALEKAGVDLPPHFYQRSETFSHASGQEAATRLLELETPPDAIFCVNDLLALGAIDGARALRIRVPENLWVVGYDDVELASWGAYDLTTVRQPMEQMVAHAIDLLLAKIANRDKPLEHKCFPNELVIRRSTGRQPFPGTDEPPTHSNGGTTDLTTRITLP